MTQKLLGKVSSKKLCVDICSGLGGFSQSFKDDLEWEVVTLDINPKFRPDIVADVCHLPLKENLCPDVLLMSPPCERFSIAMPRWPQKGIGKALVVVGACLDAVVHLKPKRWLLENPKGRLRWFLGVPPCTVRYSDYDLKYPYNKLTDFWGNVPLPMVVKDRPIDAGQGKIGGIFDRGSRAPSKRAAIPLGMSQAVKEGAK